MAPPSTRLLLTDSRTGHETFEGFHLLRFDVQSIDDRLPVRISNDKI